MQKNEALLQKWKNGYEKVPLPEKSLLEQLDLPGDLKKLDMAQCQELCQEIRNLLIETVSKTGGHLASNLGAVELTVAMHRVFTSPEDKFVWDVGHQCYTHKILTGRLNAFSTLRQEDGISGFPKLRNRSTMSLSAGTAARQSPWQTALRGHASAGGSGALRHCSHRRRRNDRRAGV